MAGNNPQVGNSPNDRGATDLTAPTYLTRQELGLRARSVRTLSGRGTFTPGYRLIANKDEGLAPVVVLKMVSPLTGQGPASPYATGRYYMLGSNDVATPNIVRVQKSVPPNSNFKVVRPPLNAIRRMDTRGQGTVSYT